MNTNKQGRIPTYSNASKIAIAREYLTGNMGYGALAKKYDLTSSKTVEYFVKWYRKNYPPGPPLPDQTGAPAPAASSGTNDPSKQLKQASLKIAGLEILIETASKELGVDIIKKPGTKQSNK